MNFGVIIDPIFTNHRTPVGHPECGGRMESLLKAVEPFRTRADEVRFLPVSRAQKEWILAVHSEEHFQRIEATRGKAAGYLDPDTRTSPESFETAMVVAGSAVRLVEAVSSGEVNAGMLLARPPGHHAESDRAMGFCLFNNAAVAAQRAITVGAAGRVAIVDFDVHHGNGTQQIFYDRADVLYVSSHQFPFYPGTGDFSECGSGEGKGTTVNFPVSAGRGDEFFLCLYADLVAAAVRQFEPDLIVVSAGYDAHRLDPLAGMEMTSAGFAGLASLLNKVARQICGGRIVYILEGGYHLQALAKSVVATIETCLQQQETTPPEPSSDTAPYLQEARSRLQAWGCRF